MKRNRFTDEQIIGILKEHEQVAGLGALPQARCQRRQHLQVESQVRRHGRVRSQAAEDAGGREAKLKRLLADAMLDNAALKDLLGKKW
ncbi:hypothetical protein AJ87_42625 [Rhizobium yanglingense]|nr:hypothetical protein AJ87_42625 [Rhizobium yanglingense]